MLLRELFNNLSLKIRELISEGNGTDKIANDAKLATKGLVTTPAANNNAGDAYKSYRMGLALAGAPEYPTKAESEIGGDPLLSTYTDAEWDMVKYAAKQAKAGPLKRLSNKRSEEMPDVNKSSPVAKPKKNKYGI